MSDPGDSPILSSFADEEDMADLIELYVSDLPTRLQAIRQAQQEGSLQTLAQLAHQLKGSGGSHGFDALTEVASQLETAAMDQARPRVDAAVLDLHQTVNRILRAYPGSV